MEKIISLENRIATWKGIDGKILTLLGRGGSPQIVECVALQKKEVLTENLSDCVFLTISVRCDFTKWKGSTSLRYHMRRRFSRTAAFLDVCVADIFLTNRVRFLFSIIHGNVADYYG